MGSNSWNLELGEFQGGFRIIRKDDERENYYQKHLTFLKVSGMWQPSEMHEAIEVCRLTVSQDGIEIIGAQMLEDLKFMVTVEYQWHREPRRFEEMFTAEDAIHIGDGLSICRSNALPYLGNDPLHLERPCISWHGTVDNVTASPILQEVFYDEDVCPLYNLPLQQNIKVRMVGSDE
jgi:hypothetical protein